MLLSSAVMNCSNSRKRKVVNIPDKSPVCSLAYVEKKFYIELNVVIFFFPTISSSTQKSNKFKLFGGKYLLYYLALSFFFICYMVSFSLILCLCKSYWHTQCPEL